MEQQTANQQPQNKQIVYKTQGTCSQYIEVALIDGLISSCRFYGGCDGNTKGLAKLVIGMRPADVPFRYHLRAQAHQLPRPAVPGTQAASGRRRIA